MDKVFADQISKSNISNVVFVSQAGHDTFGTGDLVNPYKTIQHAINMVSVNGTVVIDSGTYTENLTITDGISLKAMSKRTVVVVGKLTINITSGNHIVCDGIDFQNGTDHTINLISPNNHNVSFYECVITQTGTGVFNAINAVLISGGDSQWKNCQISARFTTGGSKAIQVGNNTFGMTMFDCLIGVEDDADAVVIEHNATAGFIFVGKNINGQVVAQGDAIVLLAYGGITTNTVPVLVTTMATQPAIILNANIISNANPCVDGTGLFLFGNIFFFNGVYLDFASTLTGGAGAQAVKIDSAKSIRYRNLLSGLTATNIQDAIDELATSNSNRTLAVNQVAHGFVVNDEVMYDKTTSSYLKANTTGIYAIGTIGKVSVVTDVDNFVLYASGNIITRTGLTAGEFYYAKDDGTGGITLTPPTNVVQAVLFALPSNKAIELQYPAVTPSIAPSSTPLGYNDIRVSFIGANWAYEGLTNNGGGISLSGSIVVSGAAGWRNLVVDTLGVVSVETIPPAEIVSDIYQYTPNPIFDLANNGYYSSNDPTLRIIAIGYFDGTNFVTVRNYGHGAKKNDDYWETNQLGVTATAAGTRLQFTGTWDRTWGTNIVCVDNGAAVLYDDTEGFRITFLKSGKAKIQLVCGGEGSVIDLHKNALLYKQYIAYNPSSGNEYFISVDANVDANDYFTFVNYINSIGTELRSFTISFEEN